MKFKDCKVGVRVHHPWYRYGVIERLNEDIVTINFNGIKLFFFENTTERNVKELERIKINRITPKQQYRYEKSDNVRRIYRELNKKYNISKEYRINFYTFSLNGVTRIRYEDEDNNEFIVEARCSPEDKFDAKTGLEVAVRRLAEKLGVCKEEKKETKDKKEGWLPKNGDLYWSVTVTDDGLDNVSAAVWTKVSSLYWGNLLSVAIGNCFKTKEEAEKNIDKIKEKYRKMIEYSKTLNT